MVSRASTWRETTGARSRRPIRGAAGTAIAPAAPRRCPERAQSCVPTRPQILRTPDLSPAERRKLLPLVWNRLRPGGALFLNQTPCRCSPVEIHTTSGTPLINYLPDRVVLHLMRRFSLRYRGAVTWERLLRDGVRGGSVREISTIPPTAELQMILSNGRASNGEFLSAIADVSAFVGDRRRNCA